MTTCIQCKTPDPTPRTEDHRYVEGGLPNVILLDMTFRRCAKCGHDAIIIPRLEGLHRAIALAVIRKHGRLTGAEVRYLRKTLDLTTADFARLIGVGPAKVSDWEIGPPSIDPGYDRLLRLMVSYMESIGGFDVHEVFPAVEQERPDEELKFAPRPSGWLQVIPD